MKKRNTSPWQPKAKYLMLLLITALVTTACGSQQSVLKQKGPKAEAIPSTIRLPHETEEGAEKVLVWDDKDPTMQPPKFPGGAAGMAAYIRKNLKYPREALKKGIKGRVFVSYIVEKNGKVSHVRVEKGISPELDEAAWKVISRMPRWEPATKDGIPIRVRYTQSILFSY